MIVLFLWEEMPLFVENTLKLNVKHCKEKKGFSTVLQLSCEFKIILK